MQTNHGRYFIEPVYQAEPDADGQHIHVAYKRDAPHERKVQADAVSKRHCGTSGSIFIDVISIFIFCRL